MKRNIIVTFLFLLFTINTSFAKIDVVYPKTKEVTINAASTFFIGNTDYGSAFYINGYPVNLWEGNFFVQVVPLQYGRNEIKLKSIHNGTTEETIYYVKRNKTAGSGAYKAPVYTSKPANEFWYSKTIKDNSTVREKPSTSSTRLVDLPKNIILYLAGRQGDYYKIDENGATQFWIHKNNISAPVTMGVKTESKLLKQTYNTDDKYDYIKFYLSHPVLYNVKQNGDSLELTLYGVKTQNIDGSESPNLTYYYSADRTILGYDCRYEDNNLTFRIAKFPQRESVYNSLAGVTIFVDPGHGGKERGAIGPTGIAEKNINLEISKYLIEYLKQSGANVITSRTDDSQIGLYERVNIAKTNNALISVSVHNNALPDGKDPYVSHGTEVHYYNENAKLLAETIKNGLVSDLNLKDNGIHKSSFALNRSTNPVSVLVEVAYMINPEEYILLKNSEFQKRAALSIKNSIEKYINMLKK